MTKKQLENRIKKLYEKHKEVVVPTLYDYLQGKEEDLQAFELYIRKVMFKDYKIEFAIIGEDKNVARLNVILDYSPLAKEDLLLEFTLEEKEEKINVEVSFAYLPKEVIERAKEKVKENIKKAQEKKGE